MYMIVYTPCKGGGGGGDDYDDDNDDDDNNNNNNTWNITHYTESTSDWNLKPERWGSPLVQEKYRGEKACDKRQQQQHHHQQQQQQHNNNNNNNNNSSVSGTHSQIR